MASAFTPTWLSGGNWLACAVVSCDCHARTYFSRAYKELESSGLYYYYTYILAQHITKARQRPAFGVPGMRVVFVKATTNGMMKGGAFEAGHHPIRNYENEP